ncbi:pitrilysin family protein [Ahrensia sp. R2A130]|uniref:M16 family metallopeptidase n=1 Tax=Ahrensia sp. R2A130 TaxID=744979 RepID=UPI0001E09479|nr:pitrilysin family protein [Ahrensia sp. R2A130]EFL88566.1 protease [Ahrensia sp. R2A130]
MTTYLTKTALRGAATLFAILAFVTHAFAVDIKTVTSDKGITALLVEDYTVPLVAMSYSFKGGSTQDVVGKEGTSELLTNTLDEGAGDITSQDFQERLSDNGMSYSFNSGYEDFSGSIKALAAEKDEAFELLRLMLNEPRFDEEPVGRMKASRLNGLKRQETNPQAIAGKAFRENVFADHPYSRPSEGTLETMPAITGEDLESYRKRVFARDNLVIGVVGAISPDELKAALDKIFGDLPEKAQLEEVAPLAISTGETIHIDLATPQTNIRLALPGIKRDDPDFFTAYLVNYVLGGGSFSSRLYDEVREKRGLAYGVYSYLGTYDVGGIIGAGSATRSDRAQTTVDIILAEMKRMAEEGPTAEELEKARKYITGSYAIANLDTSSKIASVLVAIQQSDLGIDYIDRRKDYLAAVTLEDAKRVAKRLYGGKPTVITVGQKPKKPDAG